MAGQPKLVNKQFNSPIGLYSETNVREILDRESQMLSNGAVGINFQNPISSKPANLQNSAVLRMLEEEENRQRNGQAPGFKSEANPHPAWPPPGVNNRQRRFHDVVISGVKRVAWPPPKEGDDEFCEQEAVQAQGGAQYSTQKPTNQQPPQQQQQTTSPILASQRPANSPQRPWATAPSPQPTSPPNFNSQQTLLLQQVPKHQQQQLQQQYNNAPQAFNQTPQPAYSPVLQQQIRPQSPQPYNPNAQLQQQQPQQQQQQRPLWSPVQNQVTSPKPQPQQNQQPPQYEQQIQVQVQPTRTFEPPPSTITLRPTVPISQAPAPILTSQPATATLKGGKNLRGDLKWPPENVKGRMEAESRQKMELEQGPACRPRRIAKDYSTFFAQHALNSSYPGYKIPPGTQYYDHQPMI